MRFLKKDLMQKKTREVLVVPHPLLAEVDLPLGSKMLYLQGCVLAALLDDEKVSKEEDQNIRRIGQSLGLSPEEVNDAFALVEGLNGDDDKESFIDELKRGVYTYPVSKYFMADFEEVMKKKGKLPKAANEFLDFIGQQVTGAEDWRAALESARKRKVAESKAAAKSKATKKDKSAAKLADEETKAVKTVAPKANASAYGFGDRVWRSNPEHNGIECSFEGKPSESVRNKLKAAGFRFSGKQGLWYAKDCEKSRKAIADLRLACADGEDDDESDASGADEQEPISVYELIELIENENIDVTVEDEDECQPEIKDAEVETDWDNECKLKVTWGFPDGTAGRMVFEVAGVRFTADRNFDGTHDDFEISGREIDYGDDELDEDSVLEAVADNLSLPEFDPDDYEMNDDDITVSAVIDALGSEPSVYAADDGDTVYGYDDEDDVDEDYEVIEQEEAIEKMIDGGQFELEKE